MEVKIWHPDRNAPALWSFPRDESIFSLHFGPLGRRINRNYRRVGDDITDWSRRDEVRGELEYALMRRRKSGWHPLTVDELRTALPIQRLVYLVMMVTAKCDEATRVVHVGADTFVRPRLCGLL